MGWLNQYAPAVQAIAAGVSLLVLLIVAIATVWYAKRTAEIAEAARRSAEQQGRVADLMKRDLEFRVAPNLYFRPLGGIGVTHKGEIKNRGPSVAVSLRTKVIYFPTKREEVVAECDFLPPDGKLPIQLILRDREGHYVIELVCTAWANLVASNPRLLLEVGKQSDSFLLMRRRGGIIMARSAKGTAAPPTKTPSAKS